MAAQVRWRTQVVRRSGWRCSTPSLGSHSMTWLYWLAGSAALGLLVYLSYALLKAEEF